MTPMLPRGVRIFVASETIDGRRSFDGLAAIVKQVLKRKPLSGDLYVFRNRTSRLAKHLGRHVALCFPGRRSAK